MEENIDHRFDGSVDDLKREIDSFNEQAEEKKNEHIKLSSNRNGKAEKQSGITQQINKINMELATLMEQRKAEQSLFAKKAKLTRALCEKLNIPVTFDIENCDERANEYADDIRAKLTERTGNFEASKMQCKLIIDEVEGKMRAVDAEISKKESQRFENNKRIEELNQSSTKLKLLIKNSEEDAERLKAIIAEIDAKQKQLDDLRNADTIEKNRSSIAEKKAQRSQMSDRLEDLDDEIMVLNSNAALHTEISLKKQELKKNDEQVKRFLNKHDKKIEKLFGSQPIEKDYKRKFDSLISEQKIELKTLEESWRKSERSEGTLKNSIKHKRDSLSKLNKEKQKLHEAIYELCAGNPYEEMLERTREEETEQQMKLSVLRSSEMMNKTYMEELDSRPACPLCHTDLDCSDVETLRDDLIKQTESLPSEIDEAKRRYTDVNKKLERLIALEKDVLRHKTLSDEINKLDDEIAGLERSHSAEAKSAKELKEKFTERQGAMNLATSMVTDMALLDKAKQTVSTLEDEINSLSAGLSTDATASVDDLQKERKSLAEQKRTLDADIDKLEAETRKFEQHISRLSDSLNELMKQKLAFQENIQSVSNNVDRLKEIEKSMEKMQDSNRSIKEALVPIVKRLNDLRDEKRRAEKANEKKLAQMEVELTALRNLLRDDMRLQVEIEEYKERNIDRQLLQKQSTLKELAKESDLIVSC